MARAYRKFDLEEFKKVVAESLSFAEVARRRGQKPIGGNTTNIALLCKRHGVDTSHMTGSRHSVGKPARNRRPIDDFLVLGTPQDRRVDAARLRRALHESGIEHKCAVCDLLPVWNNLPLQLQVDHINGMYWDNRRDNLRFICPNCHTQTETWGRKNAIVAELVDAAA